MTCTLDSDRQPALKFQASASDATREDLALLVDKLEQEVRVLVVDIFDTSALEAAVFLLAGLGADSVDRGRSDYGILCHNSLSI